LPEPELGKTARMALRNAGNRGAIRTGPRGRRCHQPFRRGSRSLASAGREYAVSWRCRRCTGRQFTGRQDVWQFGDNAWWWRQALRKAGQVTTRRPPGNPFQRALPLVYLNWAVW